MYNIVVRPRHRRLANIPFDVPESVEAWIDDDVIIFRCKGTRALIAARRCQLADEHLDRIVTAFWTPDLLVSVVEWLEVWSASEWLWRQSERYLCL